MEKRRQALQRILLTIHSEHPEAYYLSASDIAALIYQRLQGQEGIAPQDAKLLKSLDQEEIQYLLSFEERAPDSDGAR